mgnify:CR=1 FL=1
MAYILTVLPSNDVALELASFLDRTLEATTCVEKVKADLDAGKTAAAISHLVSESNKLWASTKATDKGTYRILLFSSCKTLLLG